MPVHLEMHQIIKGPLITEKVSDGTELANIEFFRTTGRQTASKSSSLEPLHDEIGVFPTEFGID